MSDWWIVLDAVVGLLGVLVGYWLTSPGRVEPPYFPPIANTAPPTTLDLDAKERAAHPEG